MTTESPVMKRCFEKPSVIAYKRHKNLRDMLIRAKLPPKRPRRTVNANGFKSCGELCNLCPFSPAGTTKHHSCRHTGLTYEINSPINCKTSGVIYQLTCTTCSNFLYIGGTSRPVKQLFGKHYRDAGNDNPNKPCGTHFELSGHSENDLSLIAFE